MTVVGRVALGVSLAGTLIFSVAIIQSVVGAHVASRRLKIKEAALLARAAPEVS